MTKIQYGIIHAGIIYGWIRKELYRLPCVKGKRSYRLKKMSRQVIGNNTGYALNRHKYTIKQLQEITTEINYILYNKNYGKITIN